MSATHQRALSGGLAVLALLWVALHNGYPLVWWDSGTYLEGAFSLELPPSRPLFYGLLLRVTGAPLSIWLPLVAQTLLVVVLIGWIVDAELAGRRAAVRDRALLVIVAILAIGSGLPWLTGIILSDVFAGIMVLSLYCMACGRVGGRRRAAAAAVLLLALLVHFSHLPMAIAMVLGLYAAERVLHLRLAAGALRLAWGCVAGAALLLPLASWLVAGRVAVGALPPMLVGRLLRDGIVQRLLAEHCATRAYELCAYAGEMPSSLGPYLWRDDSPFYRIGGWEGSQAESWRVIGDALRAYPLEIAAGTLRAAAEQLRLVATGDDLRPYLDGTAVEAVVRQRMPSDYPRYLAARQQRGTLAIEPWSTVHVWIYAASAVASLLVLLAAAWRRRGDGALLHLVVWLALLANALVVGAANEPIARLGVRVAWLLPFAVLVTAARCVTVEGRAPARPSQRVTKSRRSRDAGA